MKYYANKDNLKKTINEGLRATLMSIYGHESLMGIFAMQAKNLATLYIGTVKTLDQVKNLQESGYLAAAYKILDLVERIDHLLEANEDIIRGYDGSQVQNLFDAYREVWDKEITPGATAASVRGSWAEEARNRLYMVELNYLIDEVAVMPAALEGVPAYADARAIIEEEIKK